MQLCGPLDHQLSRQAKCKAWVNLLCQLLEAGLMHDWSSVGVKAAACLLNALAHYRRRYAAWAARGPSAPRDQLGAYLMLNIDGFARMLATLIGCLESLATSANDEAPRRRAKDLASAGAVSLGLIAGYADQVRALAQDHALSDATREKIRAALPIRTQDVP
jgi:hypothetical protein